MTEHTRESLGLPWKKDRIGDISDCDNQLVSEVQSRSEADFIVTAANSHHDLVEKGIAFQAAVEALCDWMNGNDLAADHAEQKPDDFERLCSTLTEFRATLAKAKGGAS